ncbi:AI-2E family transporter [Candidatus Woesearchaeota archaeon]|nr:AI-2E family transporter [Candidatus Woesearchaeota archaeon]
MLVLAFLIIRPYLIPIITSIILAYIFYPLYDWLNKKIKRENLSAVIISILIILLILIPVALVILQVSKEAQVSYILIKQNILTGNLFDTDCREDTLYCNIMQNLKSFMKKPTTRYYIDDGLKKVTIFIAESAFNFLVSLPKRILDIFITFFMVFFLLKDGKRMVDRIEQLSPIEKKNKEKIFNQLQEVTRAIIYGIFVISLLEGILGAITFKLFGISSPILWGIVMFLLAFLPMVGAGLIWIPAALIKIYNNDILSGFGIIIGGIIISTIDIFLKPKVIGDKAQIHPILVLLGVLGGLSLFSFMGVIIGPLILVLSITFIKLSRGIK